MATYKCPHCGAPCLTAKDAANHCASYLQTYKGVKPGKYTCPECKGSGEKPGGFLSPNIPCPRCGGTGKIG